MTTTVPQTRDYSLFDAELSGAALNLQLLRRLLHWLKPYWLVFSLSMLLVMVTSMLAILGPIIISIVVVDGILADETQLLAQDLGMGALVDWIAVHTGMSLLISACVLYAVIQGFWGVFSHLHRLTLIQSVINGLRDLRSDLFEHLQTRPFSFYDRVAVGRVMTRVTHDIEALYECLRGLGTLLGELVPFIFALVFMAIIDIEMTLVLMMYVPVLVVMTFIFRRYTRRLFRLVRQSVSAMNQNMQENLAGLQVVQLSTREAINHRKYQRLNGNNLLFESRSMFLETLYTAFNDSMASSAIGIIVWYLGGEVLQEEISLGAMVLFTRFIDMLFHPIVVLGDQINILFRAMASGERIFQALDWDEAIHEPVNPVALAGRCRGEIEFRHLNFAYDDKPVLNDVSFRIHAHEKLAIVGTTGSGKTTLIRLLSRFYDFPDDSIFLDGIDINRVHTSTLRTKIGVVLQDFHIFSGTIYDNIALGKPNITKEKAIAAAEQVNADSFIEALPEKYDALLAERGQNLSQGQRQLLAFARVLAADPEIFVLDEATANIDTKTELLIQDAFRKLTKDRTSIIIAHRLQTIQDCDRVLVLDQGRVAELGSHAELLAAGGIYKTLHDLQFQSTNEIETG